MVSLFNYAFQNNLLSRKQNHPLHSVQCNNCGKFFKEGGAKCQGTNFFGQPSCFFILCSDCADKCKSCKKYFCTKHLKKHKC